MIDFSVALGAGITQTEIAKVLGVSRVTINLWVNGKMKPHRYNSSNVQERLALLNEAIRQNLIPKPDRRVSRQESIAAAMQQVHDEVLA